MKDMSNLLTHLQKHIKCLIWGGKVLWLIGEGFGRYGVRMKHMATLELHDFFLTYIIPLYIYLEHKFTILLQ